MKILSKLKFLEKKNKKNKMCVDVENFEPQIENFHYIKIIPL